MSNENDGWETVTVPEGEQENKQVEFEIEEEQEEIKVEEEQEQPTVEAVQEEVQEEPVQEEQPKELEGIETKGAEKRIRQLIRQRKEREEQIEALMKQNEELKTNLAAKDNEVDSIATRSLDANERQLTQNMELARQAYMEAFEDGDKEKVLKAQEILNSAQADLKTIQNYKNHIFIPRPRNHPRLTGPAAPPMLRPLSDGRTAAARALAVRGEESPGSTGSGCRVTPGGGDPRESATENRPPAPATDRRQG